MMEILLSIALIMAVGYALFSMWTIYKRAHSEYTTTTFTQDAYQDLQRNMYDLRDDMRRMQAEVRHDIVRAVQHGREAFLQSTDVLRMTGTNVGIGVSGYARMPQMAPLQESEIRALMKMAQDKEAKADQIVTPEKPKEKPKSRYDLLRGE